MTLTARLSLVKRVPAGQGVSYGHAYITPRDTILGLVPLGYADGVPRNATNVGPVSVHGVPNVIAGRVCMDQFVVDLGPGLDRARGRRGRPVRRRPAADRPRRGGPTRRGRSAMRS